MYKTELETLLAEITESMEYVDNYMQNAVDDEGHALDDDTIMDSEDEYNELSALADEVQDLIDKGAMDESDALDSIISLVEEEVPASLHHWFDFDKYASDILGSDYTVHEIEFNGNEYTFWYM